MRKILIFSAIDDEPISLEVKFLYEALHRGVYVCEESSILRVKVCQRLHLSLWDEEQVNLIAGRRMLKGDQVWRLAEAFDRDDKAHVCKYPTDEESDKAEA